MSTDERRPRFHFTPPSGWMNDPCGLIRLDDTYHLFYQHNPGDVVWGDMHWGHATSTDLIGWQHHEIALAPDELGMIYTGSTVVDVDGTAGFGAGALVAIFTQAGPLGQVQSLAYSVDDGFTWTKYDANPVLQAPSPTPDYRDPKVIRFDGPGNPTWVMVLAAGPELQFYRSADLRSWEPASSYRPDPRSGVVLEVPDLMQVPGRAAETRWTLVYSVIPPDDSAGRVRQVHWAAGSFDGFEFTPRTTPAVLDQGPSFYASMAWAEPGDAPLLIGWMNETYPEPATTPWRGRQSIPRRLALVSSGDQLVLRQVPLVELPSKRMASVAPGASRTVDLADGAAIVHIEGPPITSGMLDASVVGDRSSQFATMRCQSTATTLSVPGHAPVLLSADVGRPLEVTLVIDVGSLEVFADGGLRVASMTTARQRPERLAIDNRTSATMQVAFGKPQPAGTL